MFRFHFRIGHALPLLLVCASIVGCRAGSETRGPDRAHAHGRAIVMDGRFDDWPRNTASLADRDFLYFRVTVEDHGMPLQAAPETVALWLDVDGDAATGLRPGEAFGAGDLGVDLMVEFSPRGDRPGRLQRGVAVYAADDNGEQVQLTHAQVDLLAAPTHAAGAYEIRIARHIDAEAPEALRRALTSRGEARSMFIVSDRDGEVLGWSDAETFRMPSASADRPRSDVVLPARPQGAVRILSWNVKDNEPLNRPSPFARVIQAVEPDVIVFQEMWDTDEATLLAWFTSVVTGDVDWIARTAPGGQGGVAIVSRHPLTPLGPDLLSLPGETLPAGEGAGAGRPVRFIAATVETPHGELAIATVHLKCCGTAGSSEDQRRLAEARTINLELGDALDGQDAPMRIIVGDFNLVGSREPLDILRAHLDTDGAGLQPVYAMVLGDAAMYTWFDAGSAFAPSRLDWAVAGRAGAEVVNAFVIDGRRLTSDSLLRSGLDGGDTAVSDHLPLVIDLRPR